MNNAERRRFLKFLSGSAAAAGLLSGCTASVMSATFSYSSDRVETFLQLSSILTGELKSELDTQLALEYIERLERTAPGVLDALLIKFRGLVIKAKGNQRYLIELVDQEIWQPKDCATESYGGAELCDRSNTPECCLARDIPLLWYAAALMEKTNLMVPTTQFVYGSAASYLNALAWKTGEAHPQAQCGGTYGYWSTKPGTPHPTKN